MSPPASSGSATATSSCARSFSTRRRCTGGATDGYFIARHEVTFREWIAFLAASPASERAPAVADASAPTRGSVQLREDEAGWQLMFQPATQRYTARAGEPIVYAGRKTLARQDWLDFPVSGVSRRRMRRRYLGWLRATGRVPERAALHRARVGAGRARRRRSRLPARRSAAAAGRELRPHLRAAGDGVRSGRRRVAPRDAQPVRSRRSGGQRARAGGVVAGGRGRAAGSRRGVLLWRGVVPQHQSRDRAGHPARRDDRISRVRDAGGGFASMRRDRREHPRDARSGWRWWRWSCPRR